MKEYTTTELMEMMEECNQYDGSFEGLYCYDIDSIDELLHGMEITQVMNMVHFGNYHPSYQYFRFDGYGNIESVHEADYMQEIEDRAEEIIEHARELGFIE